MRTDQGSEIGGIERRGISVRGIVQGVGFRPFIYSLARQYGLAGSVRNDAQGVHVEAEGTTDCLDLFLRGIEDRAPPLALIEAISWQPLSVVGERDFHIKESRSHVGSDGLNRLALVSPDMTICEACLEELFEPSNRRYRYPFINCTNCGPRFTITCQVPYDRASTTMATFPMCANCQAEYDDPSNRRFHAQPNACPACGPRVQLADRSGSPVDLKAPLPLTDPIAHSAQLLRQGAILAVKGLGGFHLACDPFNVAAVGALRDRKARQDKPFALMALNLEQASMLCYVEQKEGALLTSPERPIVLLQRHEDNGGYPVLAEYVAPRQKTLGIMLTYTPLHHVLLRDAGIPLIMTSGNRAEEPIAYRDAEAFEQLGEIADYFLIHDRPIHMRCDDSVVRMVDRRRYPVRRSRGYAPAPLRVPQPFGRHILACGGELKNTFCLARDQHVFVSHHIGDLENYETLRSFREGIEHYCRLFDIRPELVAYDLHPEYLSTKYAQELEEGGLPAIGVQHHHAHIASCLADNQRPPDETVIGVALDGTGYGIDGTIWGGEFFEGSIQDGFIRRAHLQHMPLPGGQAAIEEPWRMAIAQLLVQFGESKTLELPLEVVRQAGPQQIRLISQVLEAGREVRSLTPQTSSAGRLFDAVAALCSVPGSRRTTYEGQAAIELELMASQPAHHGYPFRFRTQSDLWMVETAEIILAIVADLEAGRPVRDISAVFHRTMAEIVAEYCDRARDITGTSSVALSGGTFQNMRLLMQATELLEESGFVVYRHSRIPANDGGICLGQVVLADAMVREVGKVCA